MLYKPNGSSSQDDAERWSPLPPLLLSEWSSRDLAPPDFILGKWLTTTSCVLLAATTGLGKSNFSIALGMRIAAGKDFLHWQGRRKASVMYVDGEMSKRLIKQRLAEEANRVGESPTGFYALCAEDLDEHRPLNSAQGQSTILGIIDRIGGIDLIIFDFVMCLLSGSMSDEEPWAQTMPFVRELTRRGIGQLWVHHSGHDKTRGFGTSTREWQMDTVIHLEEAKLEHSDLSFKLAFKKSREKTPATRADFEEAKIALLNDQWVHEVQASAKAKASPKAQKYREALRTVADGPSGAVRSGHRAANRTDWQDRCAALGLIDADAEPKVQRADFYKYRKQLLEAGLIACDGDFSWLI